MNYRVIKQSPEYKAVTVTLCVLQVGSLLALLYEMMPVIAYVYFYLVLLAASMVNGHYQEERMESGEVLE